MKTCRSQEDGKNIIFGRINIIFKFLRVDKSKANSKILSKFSISEYREQESISNKIEMALCNMCSQSNEKK